MTRTGGDAPAGSGAAAHGHNAEPALPTSTRTMVKQPTPPNQTPPEGGGGSGGSIHHRTESFGSTGSGGGGNTPRPGQETRRPWQQPK